MGLQFHATLSKVGLAHTAAIEYSKKRRIERRRFQSKAYFPNPQWDDKIFESGFFFINHKIKGMNVCFLLLGRFRAVCKQDIVMAAASKRHNVIGV